MNYGLALYLTAPEHIMDHVNHEGRWNLVAAVQELISLALFGSELPLHMYEPRDVT